MFDARERIIGAAYVMRDNLAENVLYEIERVLPIDENVSNEEVAFSVIQNQERLTENQKRERIIGAAIVMSQDIAIKIWDYIVELVNIPETTEEKLGQALDI